MPASGSSDRRPYPAAMMRDRGRPHVPSIPRARENRVPLVERGVEEDGRRGYRPGCVR